MKLALLSDLHANAQALDACLAHAREVAGAERFAFLGDLVGYGADPGAVMDTVMALAVQGAIVLKGEGVRAHLTFYPFDWAPDQEGTYGLCFNLDEHLGFDPRTLSPKPVVPALMDPWLTMTSPP